MRDGDVFVGPPGTPIALAAFRFSAGDPTLADRLKLLAPETVPPRDPDEWGIRPTWLFKGVRIDPVAGRYFYRFEPDVGPKRSSEWELVPWSPVGAPDFGRTLEVSIHGLKVKAREAWTEIAASFVQALLDGTVLVSGRAGTPLGELVPVPKEAWKHFRVEDWDAGYAEDGCGERLYALQIASQACAESEPQRADRPKKLSRRDRAARLIDELYPNGSHQGLTDKELTDAVRKKSLSDDPNAKPPSLRTVRRAAGRDA